MKIRAGFVSNSSTSSFCLYGTYLDREAVVEYLKAKGVFTPEELEDLDGIGEGEVAEILDEYYKKNNSTISADTYYEEGGYGIKVGRGPFGIADDETGKQFRDSVKLAIQEIDPSAKPEDLCEGWRDG